MPTVLRIAGDAAVPGAIADPSYGTAIGHRDRHPMAARCDHVSKRRDVHKPLQGGDEWSLEGSREAAQHHGARRERYIPLFGLE